MSYIKILHKAATKNTSLIVRLTKESASLLLVKLAQPGLLNHPPGVLGVVGRAADDHVAVLQVCIWAFSHLVEPPRVEREVGVASGEVARVSWAYLAGGIALKELVFSFQGRLDNPIMTIHQEEALRATAVQF